MEKIRGWIRSRPITWVAVPAAVLLVAAFVGGFVVADDSGEVSHLKSELGSVEGELSDETLAKGELAEAKGKTTLELEDLEEELTAERSLNGESDSKQKATGEYNTDFPWGGGGTVGYLTIKPIAFEQSGSKWILTIEAKNEGSEPKQPFCGGAGAVLVDAENNTYTGEAVLSASSDNCGEELQPGLTGTFKSEFKLPDSAVPIGAAIYGDYEQEEEAKTWELPH